MNKLKKKKAGIKDFFKGKHGRNFLLALDVLLAIAFFAQPDLYYDSQAPDFFDRFYADSLIICGGFPHSEKNSFFGRGKQNTDVYRRNCYSIYRFFVVRIL